MLTRLKKTKQKGFTLIELMVTIAIVGILAAIAVPAYQYYINKARYSELVVAGTEMKVRVSEAISTGTIDNTGALAGMAAGSSTTALTTGVQSVAVTKRDAVAAVEAVAANAANNQAKVEPVEGAPKAYVITITPTGEHAAIPKKDVLKFTGIYDKTNSRVNWSLCGVGKGHQYVSEATACP